MFDYRRYRVRFRTVDDAWFTYQTLTCFGSMKAVALATRAHYARFPDAGPADDIYEVDVVDLGPPAVSADGPIFDDAVDLLDRMEW